MLSGTQTQTHRGIQLYIFLLQHASNHKSTADLFPKPNKQMKPFFFFKSENILFISWYKSLHCGTLLNMNLSFLNRGRAFQPCQKGTHCGSPEISKFLAGGKRELGSKKENCRPGFENECFLLAGSSLCLLLFRRVSQCCAISSLRERRHYKREFCLPATFLLFAQCGCSTGTDNQHSFIYYMFLVRLQWFSQQHRTTEAWYGPPGPSWRSSFSATFQ